MFAKPFVLSTAHKVSGADRKKLRRDLQKRLSLADDETMSLLLPAKEGELEVAKFAAPSRALLYSLDKVPLLVDTSGKGDYMPTVLALWRLPELLPQIAVRHAAVSQYLLGGADLMLPGVQVEALPGLSKGDLCSVVVPGNPAPLGVGRTVMSSADAVDRGPAGKGKFLEMLHVFGDRLWAQSSPAHATPNEGFYENAVVPLSGDPDTQQSSAEQAEAGADIAGFSLQEEGERQNGSQVARGTAREAAEEKVGSGEAGGVEAEAEGDGDAGGGPILGTADMDELLLRSLLQALRTSVRDGTLPIGGGALWNAHILPARPAGSHLDLKRSSHKKLSKLLQAHGQQGSRLLTLREEKHSKETILTGVDWRHDLLRSFRPHDTAQADDSSGQPAEGADDSIGELVIDEVYKVSPALAPIFDALRMPRGKLYTAPEAGDVAFEYVRHAGLEAGAANSAHILLDAPLCDALFKGVLKKGEVFPTELPKAQLRGAFLNRMLPQCRISRGTLQTVKKGTPPALQISAERRGGNKKVTHVAGAEAFLIDPPVLAAALQKRFAAATTVADLPGKAAGQEVVLQGNWVEKLAGYLMEVYGVPKKYIQVKELK